ncbi:MAG TPA: DsbA family protein, partial [Novosphingobium sp.]|nr:DsbA family protein [Novosphingobium sp.]
MADAANRSTPWPLIGALCLMGAGLGVLAGRQWAYSAMGDRAATEQVVHDYILAHPEILPQAVEKLHQQEAGQQLAALRPALESPFPGAVIGNPAGRRVIVEFMDFACGYCR